MLLLQLRMSRLHMLPAGAQLLQGLLERVVGQPRRVMRRLTQARHVRAYVFELFGE